MLKGMFKTFPKYNQTFFRRGLLPKYQNGIITDKLYISVIKLIIYMQYI